MFRVNIEGYKWTTKTIYEPFLPREVYIEVGNRDGKRTVVTFNSLTLIVKRVLLQQFIASSQLLT